MIDTVHDVQYAYRQLLKSFSFPGTMNRLLPEERDVDFPCKMDPAAVVLGMVLLDGETGAAFSGYDDDSLSFLQHLTYLNLNDAAETDFLFFSSGAVPVDERKKALASLKTGTFIDPHLGATAIIAVKGMFKSARSTDIFSENYLSLNGPGIEKDSERIIPLDEDWWIEGRNSLCSEFPLGIDVILHDEFMNVMAIPRSVRLTYYTRKKE